MLKLDDSSIRVAEWIPERLDDVQGIWHAARGTLHMVLSGLCQSSMHISTHGAAWSAFAQRQVNTSVRESMVHGATTCMAHALTSVSTKYALKRWYVDV